MEAGERLNQQLPAAARLPVQLMPLRPHSLGLVYFGLMYYGSCNGMPVPAGKFLVENLIPTKLSPEVYDHTIQELMRRSKRKMHLFKKKS